MDFLQVGKIVNTHALQGEVKVISNSDFKEDRFKKGSQLVIDFNGDHIEVTVATHRVHKVVTTDDEVIGEISEILETGANDVWVVKRPGQKDALIPYIEDVVKSVDIESKKVTINVLEGLL